MDDKKEYRILIVDDDALEISVLSCILNPAYKIESAENGETALRIAERFKPDLILLDIMLPGMSGFDVIKKLKESDARDIPVIFISALDTLDDEKTGLSLGAVDYITKPFHSSIIELRVKTHLKIVEQMRTIERLGMLDALTEIPNRRCFDNHLDVEWNRAVHEREPLGFFLADIDKFKFFNDTYGHANGDIALKSVAETIARALSRPNDLAARWGGEEFAAIMPGTDLGGAVKIAELVRADVETTDVKLSDGQHTNVTVSVGVGSTVPTAEDAPVGFIANVDEALYAAKAAGRNNVQTAK